MKLKNLKTKNDFFLAPMEEVNDICFRLLCKKAGAGLTWTPLTSPLTPQEQFLDDKPVLQLFATETKGIKEFMKKYDKKVSGWDFNLGCPADTAKRFGYGAYLKDLKKIEEILKLMRENTKKPLFVKIRKSSYAFEILKIAEKYCDAITIHPRTVSQGYSGEPDLDFAKKLKEKSSIPVIYSGNINEKNFNKYSEIFDSLMIGRGAMGNPNIFSKLNGKKEKIYFKDYLNLSKKYPLYFRQIKFQAMQFTKGQRNSRQLRNKLVYTKNLEEIKKLSTS